MAVINQTMILDKFTRRNKRMDFAAREAALVQLREKKQELLEELEANEISQELKADGQKDENPSELLGGRSGNLRAFIGFNPNDDPVGELKSILEENVRMIPLPQSVVSNKKDSLVYRFPVLYPSLKEIYNLTPSPSVGSSWVQAIERGMSGLNYYLFSTIKNLSKWSRSGSAIQSKNIVKSAPSKMSGRKYISELLENFKKKF